MSNSKAPPGSTLDPGHPLNDGLVADWLFNEGGGSVVNDLTGRSQITLAGTYTWLTTALGPAFQGDGTSGHGTATDSPVLRLPDTALTVAVCYEVTEVGWSISADIFAKRVGANERTWCVKSAPFNTAGDSRAIITVAGTQTPVVGNGHPLAAGGRYWQFLRWRSGVSAEFLTVNAVTRVEVERTGSTDPLTGSLTYDDKPVYLSRYTDAVPTNAYSPHRVIRARVSSVYLPDEVIRGLIEDPHAGVHRPRTWSFFPAPVELLTPEAQAAFLANMAWARTVREDPLRYLDEPAYNPDQQDHYDPIDIFEMVRAYPGAGGGAAWDATLAHAVTKNRDRGVFGAAGTLSGWRAFNGGLRRHYERTGDTDSRDAAILVKEYALYAEVPTTDLTYRVLGSRELAFATITGLNAEALGLPPRATLADKVELLKDQITEAITWPRRYGAIFRPFLSNISIRALIEFWDRHRGSADAELATLAATVPAFVKTYADHVWTLWLPPGSNAPRDFIESSDGLSSPGTWNHGSFRYSDIDVNTETVPIFSEVAASPASTTTKVYLGAELISVRSAEFGDDFYEHCALAFRSGANDGNTPIPVTGSGVESGVPFLELLTPLDFAPAAGDEIKLWDNVSGATSGVDPDTPGVAGTGGDGAATEVNLMVAWVFARVYEWTVNGVLPGGADTTYRDRHDLAFMGDKSIVVGDFFKQKVYNECYRDSITALAVRARGVTPPPAADALTLELLDPPAASNHWSGRWRVSLTKTGEAVVSDGGDPVPVTLTPSAGTVAFMPAVPLLTTDQPAAVFRCRPTGTAAFTVTASATGLTSSAAVTYTPTGAGTLATGYSLTPAVLFGTVGTAVNVTAALVPSGSSPPAGADATGGVLLVDPTPSVGGSPSYGYGAVGAYGGRSWLSGDAPEHAFSFVPSALGLASLPAANGAGLGNPSPAGFIIRAYAAVRRRFPSRSRTPARSR